MDENEPRGIDLAELSKPLKVESDSLGPVLLDVHTAGFLRWLEQGEKSARWFDPPSFVKNLLVERSVERDAVTKPTRDSVDSLGPDQLEVLARVILELARANGRLRLRKDDSSAPDSASPAPRESVGSRDSVRLRDACRAYLEHHREQTRRFMETVKGVGGFDDIIKKAGLASSILKTPAFETHRILSSAAVEKALDLSSILKSQSSIARGLLASQSVRRSAIALEGASSVLQLTDRLASLSLAEEHRRFAVQLGIGSSVLEQFRRSTEGMIGLRTWRKVEAQTQLFSNRVKWADALNRQMRIGLPASLFASLATAQLGSGIAAELAAQSVASMIRPGFETAANVALEGLVPVGPAAELLRQYDAQVEAEALSAIRNAVHILDDEDANADSFMQAFERAYAVVERLVSATPDLLRNQAFVAWLALLVGIAAASLTAYQIWGPPSTDVTMRLDRGNAELRNLNARLDADRRHDENAKHVRYVDDIVNLRAEPHARGQLIRLVYPDQPLRVIDTKDSWAKVEVFDYGTEQPVRGWVSRRYLRAAPAAD